MIFVLEDNQDRINWFKQNFGAENITVTDNPIEAMGLLMINEYSAIFLDHDLGDSQNTGEGYLRGRYGDGIDLVKQMVKFLPQIDTPIFIHSLNDPGAKNMYTLLNNAGYNVDILNFLQLVKASNAKTLRDFFIN